jgi:hypothetical protein
MVWVQVFPTGATLINQSVQQFNDNWLFLQNNIGTDHYFNSGNANEGHHQFSQYVNQAGDPALATDGVVYVKHNTTNGSFQPFFQNIFGVSQIPLYLSPGAVVFPGGGATLKVFDFAAFPVDHPCVGIYMIYQITPANSRSMGSAMFYWDGVSLTVTEISVLNNINSITDNGVAGIVVRTTAGGTFQNNLITLYP